MLWKGREESGNVEDRRGMGRGGLVIGGGAGTIVLALVWMLLGGDPRAILNQTQAVSTQPTAVPGAPNSPPSDEEGRFVAVVLKDTEDVWGELFQEAGRTYTPPKLVLFTDAVESGCGVAGAAVGPFYCPEDQRVYLDTAFFDDLARLGGPGDFARAYVIAHEVGHHVQDLLGVTARVDRLRGRLSEEEANALSVKVELQADFYAGVWAHHAQAMKHVLEPGDIDEALEAASAIGDDRLQKRSRGEVVPESFTHGTSAQRAMWFKKGFETGDPSQGNTFGAAL